MTRKITKLLAGAVVLVGISASVAVAVPDSLRRDVNAIPEVTGVLAVSGDSRARAGVGDPAVGEPVPWEAKHRIGSSTKTFTATVALQLVGEGRLGLDDPASRWVPVGEGITVRHLLGHKSGLPDYLDDHPLEKAGDEEEFKRERFRTYRAEELVEQALRKPVLFEPGKDWAYSNTNYVVAEMIIEKVTGAPWQQAVHERIVSPLGLRDTLLPGTSAYLPSPRLAAHKVLGAGGPAVDVSTYAHGHADASIISTPSDVNRFFGALLGGRLLKPELLREMQQTHRVHAYDDMWDGAGYGLGLMSRRMSCGQTMWFHGGGFLNAITDNGVTSDGSRVVTVAMAASLQPGEAPIPLAKASARLIDRALCE